MTDTTDSTDTLSNPLFARFWMLISRHETDEMRALRRKNLAGLSGRVLEFGAGSGSNFAFYPPTVHEVVALEPERRLVAEARRAAAHAPVPITVSAATVQSYVAEEPFDAVVSSLVLCSVPDLNSVVRQLYSALRPGGELRFLEHVASSGPRAGLQKLADATIWPRLAGNCHTHRHTEQALVDAGFQIAAARRVRALPGWVPSPVVGYVIGRAVRPAA